MRIPRFLSSAAFLKSGLSLLAVLGFVWALQQDVQSPAVFRANVTAFSWNKADATGEMTTCTDYCGKYGFACAAEGCSSILDWSEVPFSGGGSFRVPSDPPGHAMPFTCSESFRPTGFDSCCCGQSLASSSSQSSCARLPTTCPSGYTCDVERDSDCGCAVIRYTGGGYGTIETSGTCGEGDCTGVCQRWVNASPPPSDPTDPATCQRGMFCQSDQSMGACCTGYRMVMLEMQGTCRPDDGQWYGVEQPGGHWVTCQEILNCAGSVCGNGTCEPGEIDRIEVMMGTRYTVGCYSDCGYSQSTTPTCGNGRCENGEPVSATGALDIFGGMSNYPSDYYCPQDCVSTLAVADSHLCPVVTSSSSSCPARNPGLCPVPNLYCPFGYAEIERECEFDSRGCPWSPVCAPPPSSSSRSSSISSSHSSSSSSSPSSSSSSSSSRSSSSASTGVPIDTVSSSSSSFSSSSSLTASSTSSSSSTSVQSAASTKQNSSTFVAGEPLCGNGILESGEACDTGHPCPSGGFCTSLCTCQSLVFPSSGAATSIVRCGDGILGAGEQCDSGIPCPQNGFCTAACICQELKGTTSLCGNGVLNIREECDDGNTKNGDGCDARCRREVTQSSIQCGNDRIEGDEQCERSVPCPETNALCRNCQCFATAVPVCGNGTIESDETCETTVPCADLSFLCVSCRCVPPACGDGSWTSGEECDDGNTRSGDGCSASCTREIPTVVASETLCGNGLVEQGEECDDGNPLDGDGCSAGCFVEYISVAPLILEEELPSVVTAVAEPTLSPPVSPTPVVTGPTPKKSPQITQPAISLPVRPAASASVSSTGVFPVSIPLTLSPQPAFWQYQAMVTPAAPVSGPVGQTGPASIVIMVSGAAAGIAWMRRKKKTD